MDMRRDPQGFETRFTARWGDMDFNGHMGNVAFLAAAAQVRMEFFQEHGFEVGDFARLRVGPVVRRDELDYHREVRLLESLRATLALAGLSADGARFRLSNAFHADDGTLAARVASSGGWLDLDRRKLRAPPPELAEALRRLPRTDDFAELPALRRSAP